MSREHWLRWRQRLLWLRERLTLQVHPPRRREVRRIRAVTLGALAALSVAWAMATDIEDPSTPLDPNALINIFSTLADVAAALAALIGFFGLWRLDQVRQQVRVRRQRQRNIQQDRLDFQRRQYRQVAREVEAAQLTSQEALEQRLNQVRADAEGRFELQLTIQRHGEAAYQSLQRQMQRTLARFLLGTLAILVLAIVGLVFADALASWPWTTRLLVMLAGVGLGVGPALVIREAFYQAANPPTTR
jgi:hypothetical protein